MRASRRLLLQGIAAGAASIGMRPVFSVANAADGFIEITAGQSTQKLYKPDAPASDLWTYNGVSPGPEIRVKRGERVKVRLINNLDEETSIHWHGIRIDNAMDGVGNLTQKPVQPGKTFEYDFVAPDAGTYWYHAHMLSWKQVDMGLYGPLIVEDDEEAFDRDHDLTLVLDDWRLGEDGVFDADSLGSLMDWSHAGRLGNWLTVNSASFPEFKLNAGEAYRFRLINAANARILYLDPASFAKKILAYDGQSVNVPKAPQSDKLAIGPAQRVDLLVVPESDFSLSEHTGNEGYPFAHFKVSKANSAVPSSVALKPNKLPEPKPEGALPVRLVMGGGAMRMSGDIIYKGKPLQREDIRRTGQLWSFNGVANLAEEPMFSVERGRTVVIETVNETAFPHAIHIHGHHFKILQQSGPPAEENDIWRDTFLINPDQTTRIAFVADNPGKWLLHCHMLEHAAAGMNTWFEVG